MAVTVTAQCGTFSAGAARRLIGFVCTDETSGVSIGFSFVSVEAGMSKFTGRDRRIGC
jgi:hypothetical protein